MIDSRIATQKQGCLVVLLLNFAIEIDIGVHTQVLASGHTLVLSTKPSATTARTNLIGVISTTDDSSLTLA